MPETGRLRTADAGEVGVEEGRVALTVETITLGCLTETFAVADEENRFC